MDYEMEGLGFPCFGVGLEAEQDRKFLNIYSPLTTSVVQALDYMMEFAAKNKRTDFCIVYC